MLAAVLARLEGGAPSQGPQGVAAIPVKVDTPVIMVLLGQENNPAGDTEHAALDARPEAEKSPAPPDPNEVVGTHPGLERFSTLEANKSALAPQSCFMEPNRVCVHSGACEMRGF